MCGEPPLTLFIFLHLEIISERLEREFDINLITTTPGVIYKLSKRDGEKFGIPVYPIEWKESERLTYKGFREIGFEIEAFINFICMIGWNPGTEDEIFTLETLTKIFDTKRIIKSGAKYDYEKAKWFNLEHLKKIETDSLKKEFENKILEAEIDFDKVKEARIKGFMGLGQPLKSFRDYPFNPVNYMNKEYLDSLGDLKKDKE